MSWRKSCSVLALYVETLNHWIVLRRLNEMSGRCNLIRLDAYPPNRTRRSTSDQRVIWLICPEAPTGHLAAYRRCRQVSVLRGWQRDSLWPARWSTRWEWQCARVGLSASVVRSADDKWRRIVRWRWQPASSRKRWLKRLSNEKFIHSF